MAREISINLDINGHRTDVTISANQTLLEVLRGLDYFDVKSGCEKGDCGACAVLIDGKPVTSCLVLTASAEGKKIMTIEGLADGWELHPIQQAFVDNHGMQCGYCTPGAIIAAKGLLDENPKPSEGEVRQALSGNLCRCGSYAKMVKSVLAAAG